MTPRSWFPLLGVVFAVGYAIREPFLMVMPGMVGVILAIAAWWGRRALEQVYYRRRPFFWRGFPGERVELQLEVENRKFLPLSWLRVQDPWPEDIGPDPEGILGPFHIPRVGLLTNVFSLRWYERRLRRYSLLLRCRGVYRLGPAWFESGDLFGLYENSAEAGIRELFTVFPTPLRFNQLPLPADDPSGEIRSPRRIYEDPTMAMGIRDYQPEDDFRRVHWPASARIGQLQAKVYQPVSSRVVVVALNAATYYHHWEGTDRDLLEYAISLTAGLVSQGIEDGYRVGLVSNGCLANADQPFRILPGASTRHQALMLEALAGVTPLITTPFSTYLMREVPRLPYRASLIVVSVVVPDDLLKTLIQLKRRGRQTTLIALSKTKPTPIPGIRIVHAPYLPGSQGSGRDGLPGRLPDG